MNSYVFPGQGSQIKGMGKGLFDLFPQQTQLASDILGYSIKDLCLANPDNKLTRTQYTQPALYVVNALTYFREQQQGAPLPAYLAGHSLGEYNALMASGALSFEDGLKLVQKRGELMSKAPEGGMAAILGLSAEAVRQCLDENQLSGIDIANINAPTQIVIAGQTQDIHKCFKAFQTAGGTFIPLNVSGAFHSRYMSAAKDTFETFLKEFSFSEFKVPVIANVTACTYEPGNIAKTLADQITHPVRWTESMHFLLNHGVSEIKELGPGEVLTKLWSKIKDSHQFTGIQATPTPDRKPVDALITENATQVVTLTQQIRDWNTQYPIGTEVSIDGYDEPIKTRTEAMILFGHRAAIYLEGKKGYFPLNSVSPLFTESAVS